VLDDARRAVESAGWNDPWGAEATRLLLYLLLSPACDGSTARPKVRMLKGRLLVRKSTAAPAKTSEVSAPTGCFAKASEV